MKYINFRKIIEIYNQRLKYYDYMEYKKVIEEYKIYLENYYKKRKNKNYVNTIDILSYLLINKKFIPNINNDYIVYSLRTIKIKKVEYNIINELGSGAFGKVYKVEIYGITYALKECRIDKIHYSDVFLNEINTLKIVTKIKPKIAPTYYDSWINNNKGYILSEYINCGTLYEYLQKNELSSKDYNELKKLIDVLHKYNLLHEDLHGNNILIECKNDKKFRFYINDFGLTKKKNIVLNDALEQDYRIIKNENNINYKTLKKFINYKLNNTNTTEIVQVLAINYIIQNNAINLTAKNNIN